MIRSKVKDCASQMGGIGPKIRTYLGTYLTFNHSIWGHFISETTCIIVVVVASNSSTLRTTKSDFVLPQYYRSCPSLLVLPLDELLQFHQYPSRNLQAWKICLSLQILIRKPWVRHLKNLVQVTISRVIYRMGKDVVNWRWVHHLLHLAKR